MIILKTSKTVSWAAIDWSKINKTVFKWQVSIYKASKAGDVKKVRMLQNRLLKSHMVKLLAVRRVTQDNREKNTAGIDKVKTISPKERMALANQLSIPCKDKPLRRVWIPKPGKAEKRPLGIPTIKDRCLQALLKIVIEPEWEAKFEPNSYGFRPGRGCHDAVSAIRNYLTKDSRYVLDADIAKCFDRIDHEKLLDKLGYKGSIRKQIAYWLKAGVMDKDAFSRTDTGTPQGGVISPLLSNIALHGLENRLKDLVQTFDLRGGGKDKVTKLKKSRKRQTLAVIRYADDFVIMHKRKDVVMACKEETTRFLADIGLELSPSKTRMTHTLELTAQDTEEQGFDGKAGFNFLGFTIKQFHTKHRDSSSRIGERHGYKTLIFPSAEKCSAHQKKLHDLIIKRSKTISQTILIKKLNPLITGWSRYFGLSDANTTLHLSKMDFLLYLKLRRWARRRKKNSAKKASRYWKSIGKQKWVFSAGKGCSLLSHTKYSTPLSKYAKVREEASKFDGDVIYWTKRLDKNPLLPTRTSKLLKSQNGYCTWCQSAFLTGDILEVDHIIPSHAGGKDEYKNLQLLHGHCHDKKSAMDLLTYPTRRMKSRGGNFTE